MRHVAFASGLAISVLLTSGSSSSAQSPQAPAKGLPVPAAVSKAAPAPQATAKALPMPMAPSKTLAMPSLPSKQMPPGWGRRPRRWLHLPRWPPRLNGRWSSFDRTVVSSQSISTTSRAATAGVNTLPISWSSDGIATLVLRIDLLMSGF